MIITEMKEVSKSRCRICTDSESDFVLYKGEIRRFHLREGEEILEADYMTIMNELLPKRAKLRCMNLLKSRDYTEQQLRNKLRQGGYPEVIIDEAIQYVASYRYIDDKRYAVDYITLHEGRKSRRQLEQALYAKGISGETAAEAFLVWEEAGGSQDEQRMIIKLLEKKHFDPETADIKERQRIYAFLLRKGFPCDLVRKTMNLMEEY